MIPATRVIVIVLAAAGASCRTAGVADVAGVPPVPELVQPGAPGQATRVITADRATDLSKVQFTPADVQFMQGMIGHHGQAVEMVALLNARSASADMKKLGQRIELSQIDEMKMMRRWLEVRGQEIPDEHAMHMHGATLMPGMLTAEEMARLAAATGAEFDRLFLEGMIKHHGGALTMVDELFTHPGAAQDSEVFAFVSDVDADQRMEMSRMGSMLQEMQK